MLITGPQDLLASYDRCTAISTVAVAIGIFGEYISHFYFERPSRKELVKTLITLFFGALVLGGVVGEFVFGVKISRLSKEIQQASDQTVTALNVQLATVNLQIADSNKQAAMASRDAKIAAKQSAEVNVKAGKLENAAAIQRKRAASLEHEAEQLRQSNLATETQLSKANQDLENEKTQRLAMEESLAPRQLALIVNGREHSNFSPLLPFAGINVIVEYVPDAEAQRAAQEIATFVTTAGWKVLSSSPNPKLNTSFYDGVFIEFYSGRFYVQGRPNFQNQENSRRCSEAAEQLEAILTANDWATRIDPGGDISELSQSTVKIQVGMKPNRFPTRQWKAWEKQRNDWLKAHGYPAPPETK